MKLSKTNSKSKIKLVARFLVLVLACFASMLTLSACNLFAKDNEGSETNPTFDANGKLRVATPYVVFNAILEKVSLKVKKSLMDVIL